MLPKKIEDLLNSENNDDNKIAWEMIEKQHIAYSDVKDYLERTKVAVQWSYKYYFDNSTYEWARNENFGDNFGEDY